VLEQLDGFARSFLQIVVVGHSGDVMCLAA
jgi:hypothetical protein